MNTRFWGFLACLTGWAAVAHSASLLQAQSFPKTFNDLSFTDRMAVRAEGYAPFETEYDAQGRCISGCPYTGMTIEDEETAIKRLTDQAHRDLAAYRAQRAAAARTAMGTQTSNTAQTSDVSNAQSNSSVPPVPNLPHLPTITSDAQQGTVSTLPPPIYAPQQPSAPYTEQPEQNEPEQNEPEQNEPEQNEPEQPQPARPALIERVTPVPTQPAQPLNPSGPAQPVNPQPAQPFYPSEPEPEPEPEQPAQPSAPVATRTCNPYVASTPVGNMLPTGCPLGANPMIITSPFSTARYHPTKHVYKSHHGVDLRAAMGTDVFATAAGVVSYVGNEPNGCGTYVKILHDSNYATTYCHLSRALVSKGDKVEAGCRIGLSGNTGASSAPHLHYAITPDAAKGNKVAIDPTIMIEYCTLKNK